MQIMNESNKIIDDLFEQETPPLQYPTTQTPDEVQLYFNDISAFPLLSAKEEISLTKKCLKGCLESREKMIKSNLRLVVKIARRYLNRGLPLLDLIAEGNRGLFHAIKKFDPDKGYRFSTYATPWIKQHIEYAIMNQARIVRLPVHIIKELNAYLRTIQELSNDMTNPPTFDIIAKKLNCSVESVNKLMYLNEKVISLDVSANETNNPLLDLLIDEEDLGPEQITVSDDLKQKMVNWLYQLNPSQREVIARRYGLLGYNISTLDEVSKDIGLTRERVRQIQIEGLSLLKKKLDSQNINYEMLFSL